MASAAVCSISLTPTCDAAFAFTQIIFPQQHRNLYIPPVFTSTFTPSPHLTQGSHFQQTWIAYFSHHAPLTSSPPSPNPPPWTARSTNSPESANPHQKAPQMRAGALRPRLQKPPLRAPQSKSSSVQTAHIPTHGPGISLARCSPNTPPPSATYQKTRRVSR
jgi:hypothetical protein